MYFEKAASGLSQLPHYLLTIVIVGIAYAVLGQLPLMGVLLYKINSNPDIGMAELDAFQSNMDFSTFSMSSNFGFFLMLLIFVIAMIALMLCVKLIHRRPFIRMITPQQSINWPKILFGFSLWALLAVGMEAVTYFLHPEVYALQFKPLSFIVLLVLSLVLLPIQTSLEELFFRGYLMPGFGRAIGNKWLPLILSSLLFGLMHAFNPEVAKYGFVTMQIYYLSAGLFLGLITILDDSLELALGVHAATNFLGATLLSFEGSVLQTDTLFKASEVNPIMMTVSFIVAAIVFTLICQKKYGWGGLSKLWEPVGKYEESIQASTTTQHLVD